MRKTPLFTLTLAAAITFAACDPGTNSNKPVSNANAGTNTNTNTAKPVAAAPTADTFLTMDRQANEAYIKGDAKFFEGMLGDKFLMFGTDGTRFDKATSIKMIASVKCDVKDGWKLDEPQMAKIDGDTYAFSYKGTFDGTCTENGKSMKLPSPVRGGSVYSRSGDKWVAVYHGENLIVDPKAPPAPPAKAEKKDMAKKDMAKKDDAKQAVSADTMTAPPAPVKSANTDALVKLQAAGWEAWRTKDAKNFEATTTKDISFVDPMGGWVSGQAATIKAWTEMPCEGVTKTSFTDGVATAISPTVEILTGKGTSDGTCMGQKNGDIYQSAVYVKEGDAWKLAFMFESMPMAGM